MTAWTDERIDKIITEASSAFTSYGGIVIMAAHMREMRSDHESTMRQNQQLAALVAEQQRRINVLEETVDQQHGELFEWRQRELVKVT